jgi:hypothetical protein
LRELIELLTTERQFNRRYIEQLEEKLHRLTGGTAPLRDSTGDH